MKHAIKLVSAVALLGSALFSINAHAGCYCAGGVPIGGNNCGIPNQGTGGWQHIFPMTCTGGSSTPSRSINQDEIGSSAYSMRPIDENWVKTRKNATLAVVVDKKTDKIFSSPATLGNADTVREALRNQCQQTKGDCYSVYVKDMEKKCITVYKTPTSEQGGFLFRNRKLYNHSSKEWTTSSEKNSAYQLIQNMNGTPIKDICLN